MPIEDNVSFNENYGNFSNIDPCSSNNSLFFDIFVTFSYLTIVCISLFGNGIVCYLVHFAPKFKTVTNLFISNLSIGDIFMTLICVPFTSISTIILQHWPFGTEICKIVSFFQAVSVFVSAYTMVAISFDRYMAIMHPLRPRMKKSQAISIIFLVWLVAILTALPIAIFSKSYQPIDYHEICEKYVCMEDWESKMLHLMYSVVLMILQYVIPFIALVFSYAKIAVVVWGKEIPGEAENLRDTRMALRKRKMIKMMVTVVIVFTICWLPLNLLQILSSIDIDLNVGKEKFKYVYFSFHWLAMSHTCYNPVIYAYMNNLYRNGFISVLSKVSCLKKILPAMADERGTSFAMTGQDLDHDSSLRRIHVGSTSVSTLTKNGTIRSSLIRHQNSLLSKPDI